MALSNGFDHENIIFWVTCSQWRGGMEVMMRRTTMKTMHSVAGPIHRHSNIRYDIYQVNYLCLGSLKLVLSLIIQTISNATYEQGIQFMTSAWPMRFSDVTFHASFHMNI